MADRQPGQGRSLLLPVPLCETFPPPPPGLPSVAGPCWPPVYPPLPGPPCQRPAPCLCIPGRNPEHFLPQLTLFSTRVTTPCFARGYMSTVGHDRGLQTINKPAGYPAPTGPWGRRGETQHNTEIRRVPCAVATGPNPAP